METEIKPMSFSNITIKTIIARFRVHWYSQYLFVLIITLKWEPDLSELKSIFSFTRSKPRVALLIVIWAESDKPKRSYRGGTWFRAWCHLICCLWALVLIRRGPSQVLFSFKGTELNLFGACPTFPGLICLLSCSKCGHSCSVWCEDSLFKMVLKDKQRTKVHCTNTPNNTHIIHRLMRPDCFNCLWLHTDLQETRAHNYFLYFLRIIRKFQSIFICGWCTWNTWKILLFWCHF